MKIFARSMMAVLAVVSISSLAKADMIFKSEAHPAVQLRLNDDKSAVIETLVPDAPAAIALVRGTWSGENSSLTLSREEGDVCPGYSIELYHDIKLGENQAAVVRAKIEESGSAAHQYCGKMTGLDGTYVRVN